MSVFLHIITATQNGTANKFEYDTAAKIQVMRAIDSLTQTTCSHSELFIDNCNNSGVSDKTGGYLYYTINNIT